MQIAKRLNDYIHQHIPITKSLGCEIQSAAQDKVIVTAPFLNNINHQSTVFGGSLHTVATLACWGLLYANFVDKLGAIDIVIHHSEIDYLKPVTRDFSAISLKPAPLSWEKFEKMLERKGKSRIKIRSTICENEEVLVDYQGVFVVINST